MPNTAKSASQRSPPNAAASTRQKRCRIEETPRDSDILFFGQQDLTCAHAANKAFANIVEQLLTRYEEYFDKTVICRIVVDGLSSHLPPVRFMHRNKVTKEWTRLSYDVAVRITQCAFERALQEATNQATGEDTNESRDVLCYLNHAHGTTSASNCLPPNQIEPVPSPRDNLNNVVDDDCNDDAQKRQTQKRQVSGTECMDISLPETHNSFPSFDFESQAQLLLSEPDKYDFESSWSMEDVNELMTALDLPLIAYYRAL